MGNKRSGKTTLVLRMQSQDLDCILDPSPTFGQEIFVVKSKYMNGRILNILEIGGENVYRHLISKKAINNADGYIFIIDGQIKLKRDNLSNILDLFQYVTPLIAKNRPILVLINKSDLDVIDESQLLCAIDLSLFQRHNFKIFSCSTKYGNGVKSALTWLLDKLESMGVGVVHS